MELINISYTLMFTSTILFVLRYRKVPHLKKMRYFLLYISLMALVEVYSLYYYTIYNPQGMFPNFVYNLVVFFEFNLIFLFYKELANNKLTIKYINWTLVVFNIAYFVSIFYYGKDIVTKYMNYILVFGAFLVSINFVLYLREFLMSDKILNYSKDITFWITIGFLLYYLGTLPLNAAHGVVDFKQGVNIFNIQITLTIIMHSCFIFGIIKCWKKKT